MSTLRFPPSPSSLSARQRLIQHRASRLPFKAAVRLAADALFGFTHCAAHGKALWSDAVYVWLGSATFLHWAMDEADVDIPRMVVKTAGAPQSPDRLQKAVHQELLVYWADRLISLPSKSTPGWLPLP